MSKKNILFFAVLIGVVIFIAYRWESPEHTPDSAAVSKETSSEKKDLRQRTLASPPPPVSAVSKENASAGFLPTQMEDPKRFDAFQKRLKEMSQCLGLKVNSLDPQSELNFETFNAAISSELGEIVAQQTVWTTTDIRTKAGETRRIYIENNFENNDGLNARTLKYYSLGSDGSQKEIPLTKEQTVNPSDSLVASLEADGDLLGNSLARRIVYRNGDDLFLVERSGKIYSFDFAHGPKLYKCTGADSTEAMKCSCER
ncbi:MAG: hypothetical protein ACXVCY_14530 [Pseudobdellovibrionaceae bacterium]